MRIAKLRIHNFRSVRHLELECGELTVLLGPNNHGKSNILGAIEFALSTSTSANPRLEDFCIFRDQNTDSDIWVEIVFADLSDQEKITFQRYVNPNGNVTIRKTARIRQRDVEVSYNGYVAEPDEWWLKSSEVEKLLKREDVDSYAKTIPELSALLQQSGRLTKQRVEEFQRDYISAHKHELHLTDVLESGPLLGARNIGGGTLPDFYLIPAVRDLSDEMKVKATTTFGRLLQRAIQDMATQNPAYQELREQLGDLVDKLNAREDNADRPSELTQIEKAIAAELQDWGVKVHIEVTTPEIEKILELGTGLEIDDGSTTSAERKGHGLQRAVLFALLRTWANVAKMSRTNSTVPRKASQSLIFAFEEPELFLHPQAQRRLANAIKDLAGVHEHQIVLCTHSTHFVDMDDYKNIVIVSKPSPVDGTKVKYCRSDLFEGDDAKSRKDRFHMASWINPDRGELFFAKKVILVEGETEKTILPFLANRFSCMDSEVSLIDCGSKHNLPLYISVLNAFDIPYVVVHDEDPLPPVIPTNWDENKRREKRRTFELNAEIAAAVRNDIGSVCTLSPDFEGAAGISHTQADRKGKAIAALDFFSGIDLETVPGQIKSTLEIVYGVTLEEGNGLAIAANASSD